MASGLAWTSDGNGTIELSKLHIIPNFMPIATGFSNAGLGSNLMREDAARQLSGLQQAFWRKFKRRLFVSEAYRPLIIQDKYWDRYINKKPNWTLAALPKTSIHGWALSADLSVEGVGNPSGEYLQWLNQNAELYGFINDVGSEPWHWSYRTDRCTATIVVNVYITNPQAEEQNSGEVDPNTARKVLMSAADSLTYYQRKDTKGVKENKYFVAGAGVFADVVTLDKDGNEQRTPLKTRTGLSSKAIREMMNREGIKAVILDARDYDERRAFYAALAAINK